MCHLLALQGTHHIFHVSGLRVKNFRRVLNVVFFLLSDSPASGFYVPTFRNMKLIKSVSKRLRIKFRRRVFPPPNKE